MKKAPHGELFTLLEQYATLNVAFCCKLRTFCLAKICTSAYAQIREFYPNLNTGTLLKVFFTVQYSPMKMT